MSAVERSTGLFIRSTQHPKSMGHTRSQYRQFYVPIIAYAFSGLDRSSDNAYGTEPTKLTYGSTVNIDISTGEGILAVGRLENISPNNVTTDTRLANAEIYKLFYLPYSIIAIDANRDSSDYKRGNPTYLPNQLGTVATVRVLEPGTRIIIPTESIQPFYDLATNGTVFEILDAPINITGDFVEHEATIARVEGHAPVNIGQV